MDDPRDTASLWSAARPSDLRRIADLARRLFAVPAVTIASVDPDHVRHVSGDLVDGLPVCDVALAIDSAAGPRIGSLRLHGARDWSDGDWATLDDIAACLCSLIESRHAAAQRDTGALAVPPPAAQPFQLAEPEQGREPEAGDEAESGAEAASRILLADDLDLNRKLISDMLAIDGHAVDSVSDGEAAVQAAGEHAYDLILMDMIMPVMDGMAATRAIRALPAPACDVPIVALTAYSLPDQLDNCMKAGVDAVLIKPMSIAALNEAIATWSGRRRAA